MILAWYIYGFSFQIKKRRFFDICGFEDIVFNESACNDLVTVPRKKETITA